MNSRYHFRGGFLPCHNTKLRRTSRKQLLLAGLLVLGSSSAHALVSTYDVSFETSGQSIWGAGESYTLDETKFIGAQWTDKTTSLGGIAGSASEHVPGTGGTIPNPLYPAAWLAWQACDITPFCDPGSKPSTTIANPIPYATIDSRTGVLVSGNTSGKVGIELGVTIDSGSVDATVSYAATLDIPDDNFLTTGDIYNFNADSTLAGVNSLDTTFSSLTLSADAVMQLSGSVSATGCVALAGCDSGGDSFSVNERASIVSFNEDGEGGIEFLGQTPSDLGLPDAADGFPVELDVAGLATVTVHLPQPDASGGLNVSTQTLQATGQDDLVDIIVDADNVIATAAGAPGLFGTSVDIPVLGTLGYDIINVELGPTIDLQQDFELDPTLFVELSFSQLVEIGGEWVDSVSSAWDSLPDMAFLSGITSITPVFTISALLDNETLLDINFDFGIDLLQIYYDFGLLGSDSFGVGNVLSESLDLFDTPAFYSNLDFLLGGFSSFEGDAFDVVVSTPEPPVVLLLAMGLLGLGFSRRINK